MMKSNFDDEEGQVQNVLKVEIQCITPPDEQQLAKMRAFFMAEYQADDIDFVIRKDPSVVGGFRIFVGDENYDWSTLGRIRQLRKSFQSLKKENDPTKIVSLLREDIRNFELHAGHQQVGFVVYVGDGIAVIEGLHEVEYGEIVLFDCGVNGGHSDQYENTGQDHRSAGQAGR